MASQVDICNFALSNIGAKSITAIDQISEEARKCLLFWEQALDSTLRSHDWNFAGQNIALALIADETVIGWDYLYGYPANCLMIRKIYSESTDFDAKYTEEFEEMLSPSTNQKSIATDVEDAYARFTMRVTDTTLFDASFVKALSYELSSLLAKPLTGDLNMAKAMSAAAAGTISAAMGHNKSEGKETLKRTSTTLDSRG